MNNTVKRLYRIDDDSRLAGVCSGLGQYLRIDPVAMRLLWVAGTFATGLVPGILLYLVAWAIMPVEPGRLNHAPPATEPVADGPRT